MTVTPSGPDLTVGTVTPITASVGVSTTLSATITNIGTVSTGSTFPSFFQVATGPDGTGTVSDLTYSTLSILSGGASSVTTKAYSFTSNAEYSARACADKQNRNTTTSNDSVNELDETNNCGDWISICVGTAICGDPEIIDPILEDNNEVPGTITFSCDNASTWSILRTEGPADGIFPIIDQPYTGPITQEVTTGGNYQVICSNGPVDDIIIITYDPEPLDSSMSLVATPATAKRGTISTLFWTIANPDNTCALTATPVYPSGVGSDAGRDAAVAAINATLSDSSTRTDDNDPYGQVTLRNALRNERNGDNAVGKKSFTLEYTTDFTLTCQTTTKKVRVNVTNVNEG